MKIKVINKSNNLLPEYTTPLAAGMDIRASLTESIRVKPQQREIIGTGLFFEIPRGYECQIRSRSGMAIKSGVIVLNSPGTIDADYRGEIKVILINLSNEDFIVNNGDRIAQLVFSKFEKAEFTKVHELSESERGIGGFGHTGI